MVLAYIGVGSNLGDRLSRIECALVHLGALSEVRVLRTSSIYETDPVSDIEQGKFLNGVIEIETTLKPLKLLSELKNIERVLGRVSSGKDAPREIDLDILFYGEEVMECEELIIPHPRIAGRNFVLRGLRELGRVV